MCEGFRQRRRGEIGAGPHDFDAEGARPEIEFFDPDEDAPRLGFGEDAGCNPFCKGFKKVQAITRQFSREIRSGTGLVCVARARASGWANASARSLVIGTLLGRRWPDPRTGTGAEPFPNRHLSGVVRPQFEA